MAFLRKAVLWLLVVVLGLVLVLALSIPFDALIGRDRVAALTNLSIPNPNGPPVRAFVARPETPGPHPAVIMIHEFWGLRADIVGKATALADEGYLVIAPDTFRGGSTGWIPRAIYQTISTDPAQVNTDLDAVFAWLATQPDVVADRIAVMGFCYGGRTALLYSLHNTEIAATAIFYGMADTTPEQLTVLNGPVLGIFGGADTSIPQEEVAQLEANLDAAGIPNVMTLYPGQPHAFVTDIESIRAGGPQLEAWNQLLGFLRDTLYSAAAPNSDAPLLLADQSATTLLGTLHHRFVCGL
ncbi:MAG: dienelactone hydrolase family protein [Oscillochloris sp.]|nr:dienelactone hydrolase family protein [Oscillochloris sp.]